MRVSKILSSIYGRLLLPKTPPPETVSRLMEGMNEVYRKIVTRKSLSEKLRRTLMPFNSVSGNPFAVLPTAAVKVYGIADRTRNRLLDEMTLAKMRERDPGLKFSSSVPVGYTVHNMSAPTALDPVANAGLWAISTDAADGSALMVCLEGITADGELRSTSGPLNGTSSVEIDSTIANWVVLTKFYLTDAPKGFVTLTDGNAGVALATLPPGRSFARYTRIHFFGTPASADPYYADIMQRVGDLVGDHDEPLIPEDFHYLLVSGVVMREYLRKEKAQQYGIETNAFNEGLAALEDFVRTPAFSNSRRESIGWSQLGPWFEAGT